MRKASEYRRQRRSLASYFWRPFAYVAGGALGLLAAVVVGVAWAALDELFRDAWREVKAEESSSGAA